MKPTCSNLGTKAQLNCSAQGNIGKKRPLLKTGKKATEKSEQANCKTFSGKVFYLDLPSNVVSENLERDIKDLGGTIEGFLSKDISYLISNKKEAKYAQTLRQLSPVPSPESVQNNQNGSPHLSSRRDSCEGSSYKKPSEAVCISRGKSLVEKVIKEQEIIQSNSVLSNALSWGVKILHIDDIKYYIEQKKKELLLNKKTGTSVKETVHLMYGASYGVKNTKQGYGTQKSNWRLKKPFIKVEDRSRHYKPFYLQLYNFPVLNYPISKPCSPFDMTKKISGGPKQSMLRNKTNGKHGSEGHVQLNLKEKKKRGYCECCLKKYEDLQNHLAGEQHRNFAESSQYQVVDNIISKFVYDFVEGGQDANKQIRAKCSIGAMMPISIEKNIKLEERLKKAKMFQWWYFCKNRLNKATQEINSDNQATERLPRSLQNSASIPDPVCLTTCNTSYTSELMNKFKSKTESYTAVVNDINIVLNAAIPTFQDNRKSIEMVPILSEHHNDAVFKDKINVNAVDTGFQELQTEMHRHSRKRAQDNFSGKEIPTQLVEEEPQPKRKLEGLFLFPAKYLKTSSCDPTIGNMPIGFDTENSLQKEHCKVHETGQQLQYPVPENQSSTSLGNSTDSCPSVKLYRKVKVTSGRNRRGNQKQNTELCSKQNDELLAKQKTKTVLQSPNKTLLELFQTSKSTSDFEGFTSCLEQEGADSQEYSWEDKPSTSYLWSLFSHTSSSDACSFLGF
ncbi:protein DBF4 homolog A isoform X2 [Rhinatrema bivittatum]|uniref:protein DBF4 homolog A isoform X2 n=1 Tax=Rhinatrema bivittatum TaxID=194408 RepID=UPI0011288C22|nr:protein DBF4 homolog A isoform X2 [Rhinatrema bivittatum]